MYTVCCRMFRKSHVLNIAEIIQLFRTLFQQSVDIFEFKIPKKKRIFHAAPVMHRSATVLFLFYSFIYSNRGCLNVHKRSKYTHFFMFPPCAEFVGFLWMKKLLLTCGKLFSFSEQFFDRL